MNEILKNKEWRQLASLHEKKIIELTKDWQLTRQQKKKHPVIDFLFTYYSFSFNRLKAWTPGLGVSLEGPIVSPLSANRFAEEGGIINLRSDLLPVHRLKAFEWTHSLLLKTPKNPPSFNCFGLHEWAMVYKDENIRHQSLGLR
ncbi:MAG: 3-methyladenine DNA glycosylase, partial [Lentisphaeraceae bacterium]|nr:3-methyladenine DNA glycosylase [Lentisphaeraceae bacterium]